MKSDIFTARLSTITHEVEMAGYFLWLTTTVSLILLGFGGYFLFESVSHAGATGLPELLAGAVSLTLGIYLLWSQTQSILKSWREAPREENRDT